MLHILIKLLYSRLRALENRSPSSTNNNNYKGVANLGFATLGEEQQQVEGLKATSRGLGSNWVALRESWVVNGRGLGIKWERARK